MAAEAVAGPQQITIEPLESHQCRSTALIQLPAEHVSVLPCPGSAPRRRFEHPSGATYSCVSLRIRSGLDVGATLHQAFEGLVGVEQHAVGQHSRVVVGQCIEDRA